MPRNPAQNDSDAAAGTVWLVGAGPGDPGLITVEGQRRLRAADVVVYDALANPVLLDLARPDAELVDVGKRAKDHKMSQEQINALLVDRASAGLNVVRLKGGDPYLFGRGAEECAFCAERGVRCVVVPGVTAGIAAPAYAGIPVTHRKLASTVTFVTGHEDPTKGDTSVDYAGLAALVGKGGTACFYMGVGRLQAIADELTGHGLTADTPAAVVQWGTLPTQRSVAGTLADVRARVEEAGVSSPAIIVVGAAAGINEPGLNFFTDRPLFGRTVLVTRTRQQSSELSALLVERGAHVLEAPTIALAPTSDVERRALSEALARLCEGGYDDLVLTSANAVDVVADGIDALGKDVRSLHGVRIGVVGDATALRLDERLRLRADVVPTQTSGRGVAEAIIATGAVEGRRFLLPRADIARPDLPAMLRDAAAVDEVVAYHTRPADALPAGVVDAFDAGAIDAVTFTSSSTAKNLVSLLGERAEALRSCRRVSIGPVTSRTLDELGFPADAEAERADLPSLVEAVQRVIAARFSGVSAMTR